MVLTGLTVVLFVIATFVDEPDSRAATTDDLEILRVALARMSLEHREVLVLSRLQLDGRKANELLLAHPAAGTLRLDVGDVALFLSAIAGPEAAFVLNAVSYVALIAVLITWRQNPR